MTPKNVVGYARVSTRDQAESGASLASQRQKIEAYATMHGLDLVEIIEDAGHSAKTLDRPGMTRMLKLVGRKAVDVVVVAKLDRITRSVRDLGELVELFKRSGVEFASVGDHIDTSTAAGRLVLNVMGSVSQWEREAIGERTSEALAVMRANGQRISRHPPYGYRDNGSGWVPNEAEQRGVALMVELRGSGLSLRAIAAELERQGIWSRGGRRLSPQLVANVLARQANGQE
ncbi:MAG: recombinase family protein [Planctomycetes bacterium]|nr:recombinase family protein [Planctomycetota bacterium]